MHKHSCQPLSRPWFPPVLESVPSLRPAFALRVHSAGLQSGLASFSCLPPLVRAGGQAGRRAGTSAEEDSGRACCSLAGLCTDAWKAGFPYLLRAEVEPPHCWYSRSFRMILCSFMVKQKALAVVRMILQKQAGIFVLFFLSFSSSAVLLAL